MVAGLSSRFGGKIKQFAQIGPNNETLIEYSLNQALKAGFTKIIFIVGKMTQAPFKEMFGDFYEIKNPTATSDNQLSENSVIKNSPKEESVNKNEQSSVNSLSNRVGGREFAREKSKSIASAGSRRGVGGGISELASKKIPIYYALQEFNEQERDKPWGTVDALCAAKDIIDCPFVVCNGDDIYGEKTFQILVDHLKENKTSATIGYKLGNVLSDHGSVNRGIFQLNQDQTVKSITETFDLTKNNLQEKNLTETTPTSQNIFALQPETLEDLNKILEEFKQTNKDNRKIECLLPVELSNLIKQNKLTLKLYPTTEKWYGITNPEDEFKVKQQLKIK